MGAGPVEDRGSDVSAGPVEDGGSDVGAGPVEDGRALWVPGEALEGIAGGEV